MGKKLDEVEEREKLQHFIFGIDDVMDEFRSDAAAKGFRLDYSLDSLATLEDFILQSGIGNDDKDVDARTNCWIYLGETLIRNYGGTWEVSLNDDNTANYGLYVIVGHTKSQVEFVPIRYVKAFIIKKQKGFFAEVIQNHVNPKRLDLSHLPT